VPLLLTAFSTPFWPSAPNNSTPSLPVSSFTWAISPCQDWHRQDWAATPGLLEGIMILNFEATWVAGKRAILASSAE
jgi:phosphate transport system permease protein